MPVPMAPKTYTCPHCGWHKTVMPASDVLIRNHNWFDACPSCQHQPLETRPASLTEQMISRVKRMMGSST